MCGIAGWFCPAPIASHEATRLRAMVASLAHRGPDGSGTLIQANAALGHSRLAIIDLEHGAQPMTSTDNTVGIVFNGEIYNYRMLRRELIRKGCVFHTQSDTEVILQLYRAEGARGFARLRGMYAFALWDAEKRRGLLARDPIGIKPLFIRQAPDGELVFASEAKAILARDRRSGELDVANLHLLMNYRYLPGDRTLFRGITQVPPGTVLTWTTAGDLREYSFSTDLPIHDGKLLDALRDSVQAHFTSDVEVGAYLSGGTDSAAIAAVARELGHTGLRTFTLDVGDDPDEARNAARTAELLGLKNLRGECDDKIDHLLPRLIWHLELPKVNALQVSELARFTARHVKVALSGLGGDELFYGYNVHRILSDLHGLHKWSPTALYRWMGKYGARWIASASGVPWTEAERALHMLGSMGNWPRVYGLLRNVWDRPRLRKEIYGPRMLDSELPDAFELMESLWPQDPDPVTAAAKYEWHNKMVNDLLWQEDRCSMAVGLEVRVPFLDSPFAAKVQRMSREQLMASGRLKGYMRNMLSDLLPEEILARRKSGFQVHAPRFFKDRLTALAADFLSREEIAKHGLFNPDFVQRVIRRGTKTRLRWHYFILYLMLTTHLWLELFERGAATDSPRSSPLAGALGPSG